jgi:uroporphyrinogen decarboxylase
MKIAFTPVIYEHAASFVGRSPWDVSRDPELLFAAHRAAYIEYRQQVIAVGIDIYNIEAEAYGATVEASTEDAIPGIRRPLLDSPDAAAPPILSPRQFHELEMPALRRVLEIVGGRTNCLMGTGAMPLETPPENIRLIRDYIAA